MEIKETEKYCIITPLSPKLDFRQTCRIGSEIECRPFCKVGLDLSYVKDCTIEFIDSIKGLKNLSLFNIPSDIFAVLTSMNIDKELDLYVSETDFTEERHRLINRKFSVV